MYYYILDSVAGNDRRFRERLTDQTTDIGIAGEMVTTSALKSIDELVQIGLKKGYSTIVAVGSDAHAHRVITALMHEPPADRPVLGVIPMDTSSLVGSLLHITNWKDALAALKFRRLAYATLASIEPGKFLLTQGTIQSAKPTVFEVDVDDAHLETVSQELTLTGDCRLQIKRPVMGAERLKRGLAWLIGTDVADQATSVFHGQRIRIHAAEPAALMTGDETLARTPIVAHVVRRALKMVVARATVDSPNQSGREDQHQ